MRLESPSTRLKTAAASTSGWPSVSMKRAGNILVSLVVRCDWAASLADVLDVSDTRALETLSDPVSCGCVFFCMPTNQPKHDEMPAHETTNQVDVALSIRISNLSAKVTRNGSEQATANH